MILLPTSSFARSNAIFAAHRQVEAELLIDCEEDRTLRAGLVGMLRELRQGSSR